MAQVLVTDTNLQNIANAIRTKNGGSNTYKPGQMAQAILDIPSGSGGVSILSGTDAPSGSIGANGQIYLRYAGQDGMNLFPPDKFDLDDWTKNNAAFTVFSNQYSNGENTLVQKGGNGYERIFVPVDVTPNTNYTYSLDYYSPSGVSTGYDGQLCIAISAIDISTSASTQHPTYLASTNLSLTAANTYTAYTANFGSGSNSIVYLVIDLNITDGRECTLKFKGFKLTPESSTPGEIYAAFLKKNAAWQRLIGSNISDVTT